MGTGSLSWCAGLQTVSFKTHGRESYTVITTICSMQTAHVQDKQLSG